jgi:hypothetical protein
MGEGARLGGERMYTTSSVFEAEIRKLLNSAIDRVKDDLATGLAVQDIQTYREKVGEVRAYRNALDLCEEAASIAEKRTIGI